MKGDIYAPCVTTKKNARIWADRKLYGIAKGFKNDNPELIENCLIDAISCLTLNEMPPEVDIAIESLQMDLEQLHFITKDQLDLAVVYEEKQK